MTVQLNLFAVAQPTTTTTVTTEKLYSYEEACKLMGWDVDGDEDEVDEVEAFWAEWEAIEEEESTPMTDEDRAAGIARDEAVRLEGIASSARYHAAKKALADSRAKEIFDAKNAPTLNRAQLISEIQANYPKGVSIEAAFNYRTEVVKPLQVELYGLTCKRASWNSNGTMIVRNIPWVNPIKEQADREIFAHKKALIVATMENKLSEMNLRFSIMWSDATAFYRGNN